MNALVLALFRLSEKRCLRDTRRRREEGISSEWGHLITDAPTNTLRKARIRTVTVSPEHPSILDRESLAQLCEIKGGFGRKMRHVGGAKDSGCRVLDSCLHTGLTGYSCV
jgi:hypothetical protein